MNLGVKPDPSEAIINLGATLADTYELDSLLPRIEAALTEGLGLEWARVSLQPAESEVDPQSTIAARIMLGGDQLPVSSYVARKPTATSQTRIGRCVDDPGASAALAVGMYAWRHSWPTRRRKSRHRERV